MSRPTDSAGESSSQHEVHLTAAPHVSAVTSAVNSSLIGASSPEPHAASRAAQVTPGDGVEAQLATARRQVAELSSQLGATTVDPPDGAGQEHTAASVDLAAAAETLAAIHETLQSLLGRT